VPNPEHVRSTITALPAQAGPATPALEARAIPLALYVHVPWCVRKCPYCDFNSHTLRGELDEARYLAALLADLTADTPTAAGRSVRTVFIGGGTPSLVSGRFVGRLLEAVAERLGLAPDAEITLEANPGTAEAARFRDYRAAGVNRLSIGVQSFADAQLAALGRIHGRAEALAAVELARRAGFDNLNLDLMHGLPGQTTGAALADLETALALAPEHLSWYQLTVEPNTAFATAPPGGLPDEDLAWEIQDAGLARLAAAGLRHYEVSAHARPGRECRHNLNYWEFADYLGIGAGAHGKLTRADGAIERRWKARHPADYQARAAAGTAVGGTALLGPDDLALEFAMNALRLAEGVPLALYPARTGQPVAALAAPVARAVALGLLEPDSERFAPTPLGWRFLNRLVGLFAPDTARPAGRTP
jgi:oxygen-independent coproporphyrinogen-3 oxidase